jgi:hypothetical protein
VGGSAVRQELGHALAEVSTTVEGVAADAPDAREVNAPVVLDATLQLKRDLIAAEQRRREIEAGR